MILVVASFGIVSCGIQSEPEISSPRPVSWVRAESAAIVSERRLAGTVEAAQGAVLSFEVSGTVSEVRKQLGDRFIRGEVLAQLDDRTYRLTVDQRRGELLEATARLEEAESALQRQRALLASGAVSESAYDLAVVQYETTLNQVAIAGSRLELAEEDLADTVLRAPYNGTIAGRSVEPSQSVVAGAHAFEIQGNSGLEAVVQMPETVVAQVQIGDEYTVTFPAVPEYSSKGIVTEIGSGAHEANAFPVVLTLNGDTLTRVRAGMSAEVAFVQRSEFPESVRVPVSAYIMGENGAPSVMVFDAQNRTIERRAVTLGRLIEDDALIVAGLESGEVVVSAGLPFLTDGQEVTLINYDVRTINE